MGNKSRRERDWIRFRRVLLPPPLLLPRVSVRWRIDASGDEGERGDSVDTEAGVMNPADEEEADAEIRSLSCLIRAS